MSRPALRFAGTVFRAATNLRTTIATTEKKLPSLARSMSVSQPKTPATKVSGKPYQTKRHFSISKPSLKYGDHPDQIKTLTKIVDMVWEKDSAKIYGFIMASQQWQMPPLYVDRIFTMDDLYDLIKSDPSLEEISAIAMTRAIPAEILEQAHAEDFKIAMSKQHINFNPNIKLFDDIISGQGQDNKRILTHLVLSHLVTNNPAILRVFKKLTWKMVESMHDDPEVFAKINKRLLDGELEKATKAHELQAMVDMFYRTARFSAKIKSLRRAASSEEFAADPISGESVGTRLMSISAFAQDFKFMLNRSQRFRELHQPIDLDRVDPALHLYLQHPGLMKAIEEANAFMGNENFDGFKSQIDKINPEILSRFLNDSPIVLENLSIFTNNAIAAGPKFVNYIKSKGFEFGKNHRDLSVMQYDSELTTAIKFSNVEAVQQIMEAYHDDDIEIYNKDKKSDPLSVAKMVVKLADPANIEDVRKKEMIVKIIASFYDRKPPNSSVSASIASSSKNKSKGGKNQ